MLDQRGSVEVSQGNSCRPASRWRGRIRAVINQHGARDRAEANMERDMFDSMCVSRHAYLITTAVSGQHPTESPRDCAVAYRILR